MKLLSGERQLLVSNNGTLLLTSRRVRYDSRRWGQSRLVSIAPESVASCGLVTRDKPAVLWVAFLAHTLRNSLQLSTPEVTVICIVAAIVYFAERSAVLEIRSSGGERIAVSARELPREEVVSFIDAVESAKVGLPQAD
jgi:hypothetical protein